MEKYNCVQYLRLNSRLKKNAERSGTFCFHKKIFSLPNSSFFWDLYEVVQWLFISCLFFHRFRLQCYQATITLNLNKSAQSFRSSWEYSGAFDGSCCSNLNFSQVITYFPPHSIMVQHSWQKNSSLIEVMFWLEGVQNGAATQ